MLETLIFLVSLNLAIQIYLTWVIESRPFSTGREPDPGDHGPLPMHGNTLKVREGAPRNRVIRRTEEQEAVIEEYRQRPETI